MQIRLTPPLHAYIVTAHPTPERGDHVFYSRTADTPIDQSTLYVRFRGCLAGAGIHLIARRSTNPAARPMNTANSLWAVIA